MDKTLREVLTKSAQNSIRKDCKNVVKEDKIKKKEKKSSQPKRPPTEYSLFVKSYSGKNVINGVDYKGKPQDKMRAVAHEWHKLKDSKVNVPKYVEIEPIVEQTKLPTKLPTVRKQKRVIRRKGASIEKKLLKDNIMKFDDLPRLRQTSIFKK